MTQAFSKLGDKRQKQRHTLLTVMPVSIIDQVTRKVLHCKVDDVSDTGLGVICSDPLSVGQKLVLCTIYQEFVLLVQWCEQNNYGHHFRAGLILSDTTQSLDNLFASFFNHKTAI